ncbi:MAG TPA: bifunctional [glutamine synthetase] adenylyltransferase/[glutamine synthetase]-adenylyl-L-tyrosine phosphorylase [Methylocystis sp.]|nr:bifunctional [glutamine synthetase] adenylyltransferase/[glutamine synthetase]-adenylyl-L-tyrosine phosphorylase [Methylocystis sp.]
MSDPIGNRLAARVKIRIASADPDRAQNLLVHIIESDGSGLLEAVLAEEPQIRTLALGVFGCSPYLADLSARDPARLARLLTDDPESSLERLLARAKDPAPENEAGLMRHLRLLKQEAALLVALADLAKVWDTMTGTRALTQFADAALEAAVSFTLREASIAGKLELFDLRLPARGSGYIVIGMGKQGAYELNYSSDIDLIVFFDRSRARPTKPDEDTELYVRLTQRVVRIMSERTSEGYVFRTDLRLRPDASATPIALPLEAAYAYYESIAQNWERAAFIKARPVAGDLAAGEEFLKNLTPFVYRKYLDFTAIADVHAIKRQIHAHKGHGAIAINGHDVKLGRGGIREIEFFVQTQQLLAGGRNPGLRQRATLDALNALASGGWIEAATRDELTEAYLFLRDVEHRLQMVADAQTHSLPKDDAGVGTIACMMGFDDRESFASALRRRLECVQGHYARLFEREPQSSTLADDLNFAGEDDDPETLAALSALGFEEPSMVASSVRAWRFGRFAATRSPRAQELLNELTPALLEALASTENADQAFLAFDRFMSRLPAGVQLFSMLAQNPRLLGLIATIMGAAPKLAQTIARRPRLLDALIEPAFFETLPGRDELAARLDQQLGEARSYEDALNRARIFGQEQKFLVGVRVLTGALSARDAGRAYATLAEVVVDALFALASEEFAKTHGRVGGATAAIVALGKLGGREMTASSDLDLMLIYDADLLADSDGEQPLPAAQYFARLTQRLIAALSAATPEGPLYEVDFRLRPSGNKGPIAVRLQGFEDYQANEAWTWEHMALTRARVVAGPGEFAARVEAALRTALTRAHDAAKLREDVISMRARIEREKGSKDPWSLKQVAGGQIDIEFVAQFLQLRHGAERPDCLSTSTIEALEKLDAAGLIAPQSARTLSEASDLYQALTQALRLAIDEDFSPEHAPRGLCELLLRAAGATDIAELEARLREKQMQVRKLLVHIVGPVEPST